MTTAYDRGRRARHDVYVTEAQPPKPDAVDAVEAQLLAARRAVVRQGLSVGIATGLYGVSFGALSVASGLSVWQTCALFLLLFSGGSQFALIGILGRGGTAGAGITPPPP